VQPTGSNRVIRGGSWINDASNCRVANRNNNTPTNTNNNLGFRVVLAAPAQGSGRRSFIEPGGIQLLAHAGTKRVSPRRGW
jgi:hypothetical protein